MSGDIEDFLRRAAERRQARQANKPAVPPPPPARPEYSDARRERAPQAHDDDDLVVAEVIEEPLSKKLAELKQAQAKAQAMRQASGRADEQPRAAGGPPQSKRPSEKQSLSGELQDRPLRESILSVSRPAPTESVTTLPPAPDMKNVALEDLQVALQSPQGLRSAILLHEILARPEHRW